MSRNIWTISAAAFVALILASPTSAGPLDDAGEPSARKYPAHCYPHQSPEVIAEQNSKFVWRKADMVVVEPVRGADKVGPVQIDWCERIAPLQVDCPPNKAKEARKISRQLGEAQRKTGGGGWGDPTMVLQVLCEFPDDPGYQEQAGYAVQLWVNGTGQSKENALKSMVQRANAKQWKEGVEAGCPKLPMPDEEASPEDLEMASAQRWVVGCPGGGSTKNVTWYVDRTDEPPSELARLFSVDACFEARPSQPLDLENKQEWLKIGLCGPDARALDRAKIEKETAAMTAPLRTTALELYTRAKSNLANLERAAKAKVDSDPDYKKLLYDAPQAGWNAWVKSYQSHKAAMDATFKFEKDLFGPRKSDYQYCWQDVEPGLVKFVKSSKFKTKEAFMAGMTGPIGSVLLNALASCYSVTAPASVGALLLQVNREAREWRGPRAAVRFAMIDALSDIKADRVRFPFEYYSLQSNQKNLIRQAADPRSEKSKIPSSGGDYTQLSNGVVKKLTPVKSNKQQTMVTFKTESWMEDTHECWDTKKVRTIDTNGKVLYYRKCRSTGRKKSTSTPNPTVLLNWSSHGIKPNAFVIMKVPAGSDYGNSLRKGYPVEVYTNKSKQNLVNMYGFAL